MIPSCQYPMNPHLLPSYNAAPIHNKSWGTISPDHSPQAVHVISPSQVVSTHHISEGVAMVALLVITERSVSSAVTGGKERPHAGLWMGNIYLYQPHGLFCRRSWHFPKTCAPLAPLPPPTNRPYPVGVMLASGPRVGTGGGKKCRCRCSNISMLCAYGVGHPCGHFQHRSLFFPNARYTSIVLPSNFQPSWTVGGIGC